MDARSSFPPEVKEAIDGLDGLVLPVGVGVVGVYSCAVHEHALTVAEERPHTVFDTFARDDAPARWAGIWY